MSEINNSKYLVTVSISYYLVYRLYPVPLNQTLVTLLEHFLPILFFFGKQGNIHYAAHVVNPASISHQPHRLVISRY
jgi:hypothetical protein